MSVFLPSTVHFYSDKLVNDFITLCEVEQSKFEICVYKGGILEESHHITPKKPGEVGRLLLNLLRIHKII